MDQRIRAVLYDWDGVIQDSMPEQYKGCVAVFQAAGIKPIAFEDFCQTLTMPFMDWWRAHGVLLSESEILQCFRAGFDKKQAPLFPGARKVLWALKTEDIKLALISAGQGLILRPILAWHGLDDAFDLVIPDKDDKAPALVEACKYFGVPVSRALYVGDLVSDIRDGKQAGLRTVGFLNPMGSREILARANPDYIVTSHSELYTLVLHA